MDSYILYNGFYISKTDVIYALILFLEKLKKNKDIRPNDIRKLKNLLREAKKTYFGHLTFIISSNLTLEMEYV